MSTVHTDRITVDDLVHAGENTEMPSYAAPQGAALLALAAAALLSAEPDDGEPIEDHDEGVVQNLACAQAF
ncbi:hypothetical protein [Halostreptopolyspora alba]|uniref:Uncharacterized protein n=1 Tax=Halostreptopolyspora alba TaxID=2487137 RepID=A0A3N0E2L3_9ACTN|nr:hypothetical protein EFW17_20180 [Nocardiopsaceae bacterium YIM 96095]